MSSEQMESRLIKESAYPELWMDRISRDVILNAGEHLKIGEISICERGVPIKTFGEAGSVLSVRLDILHPRFYLRVLTGGLTGAAESYMDGDWEADNLVALIRIMALNWHVSSKMNNGLAWVAGISNRLVHALRSNTIRGSKKNIGAHYDLSNDFFQTFLDETMMYSSAYFENADQSLADASRAKLDRICRKLNLTPEDHVIEIGAGWGGFALYAAEHYGCRVTTTTISEEQYALARKRIDASGLQDRITLIKEDYRNLTGTFDKLVSIEMVEAVGHEYFDTYFEKCSSLLKRDGLMCIQAIAIADQDYEQAKNSVDFIKKHIFPGGCLPSVTSMCDSVTRKTDLCLADLDDMTPHYAKTLHLWRENMHKNRSEIIALGFDDRFFRMWDYYMAYCEGGFEEQCISTYQLTFRKPGARTTFIRYGESQGERCSQSA